MTVPLFCQGKDIERPTSGAVGPGATEIPVADAPDWFSAGPPAFMSSSDGSGVEYLGIVRAVGLQTVAVELATQQTRPEGSLLWTPSALFHWPAGEEVSTRRVRHGGVETVRSLGGVAYSTRLHSPYEVERVVIENLTEERFARLASWIEQTASDGLEEFTYVDARREVWRVRLDAPSLEWGRSGRPGLVSVAFDLQLLESAAYA